MKINKFVAKNVVTDNNEKRFSNLIIVVTVEQEKNQYS
jgi:hypothetical protein